MAALPPSPEGDFFNLMRAWVRCDKIRENQQGMRGIPGDTQGEFAWV